ncbi:hypothetical protein L9F63_013379 [Diploptera punctata]|uniref:Uncharacterized protein n=1 Tax=Diploptera punctata TaxID=6984 RepID=A0AAD8ELT5_DIPPU|nr:hypothetical protein L9F63_013379 [Diploptera punctata]
MHDITNPDYFNKGYPAEIQKDVDKLDLMISSNLLLSHRARALGALKQWVFPFAHDYLNIFKIPKELNYKRNLREMVIFAKDELTKINMTITRDGAIPTKRDRCTLNYHFYQKEPKGPFYVWKNSENINFIISLLSGEEVTVNVDIRQKFNFNAVKFSYIKLSFQALNEEKQQDLDKLLRNFEVKMTHLGNSHFHCDGKIYTMTSDSLEIRYSLVEYAPEDPAIVSEVFKKLRKGDMMLSPYAMWKFQLLDSANTGSLGKLLAFVDYIDVLLEGEGQYLNEDCISQCSNNMEVYYIVDATA